MFTGQTKKCKYNIMSITNVKNLQNLQILTWTFLWIYNFQITIFTCMSCLLLALIKSVCLSTEPVWPAGLWLWECGAGCWSVCVWLLTEGFSAKCCLSSSSSSSGSNRTRTNSEIIPCLLKISSTCTSAEFKELHGKRQPCNSSKIDHWMTLNSTVRLLHPTVTNMFRF